MSRSSAPKYALAIVAEGFEEMETIMILASLRQAGQCIKLVGLTSGPVSSLHGIWLLPDLTLADLSTATGDRPVDAVLLPAGEQTLSRLEIDPRIHRLLRQVAAQGGKVIASREGLRVLRSAGLWGNSRPDQPAGNEPSVLMREPEQSVESFARDLVRRLG